jgi:hypothetical protein
MNELISPDHRSSGNGWADQLTAYRQRTRGRIRGLERGAGVCLIERPVAVDTSSGAALSPTFFARYEQSWDRYEQSVDCCGELW